MLDSSVSFCCCSVLPDVDFVENFFSRPLLCRRKEKVIPRGGETVSESLIRLKNALYIHKCVKCLSLLSKELARNASKQAAMKRSLSTLFFRILYRL